MPYMGGKARIAAAVWQRFGDVPNLVEPFAGSLAVLLARPDSHRWWERTETANDADGLLANYWRATQADPDAVAQWADRPIHECDLHAIHAYLVAHMGDLQAWLEGDPDYYDAKMAGWWLFGICLWIGTGFCSGEGPWQVEGGQLVHLGNAGRGINRQRVHLGPWSGGNGINRRVDLPDIAPDGSGHADAWSAHLRATMQRLADRLRRVRVCCGDWARVCGPSPTFKHGLTGVFLDPPYSTVDRQADLYRVDSGDVAAEVMAWAIANGDNPLLRIAVCGYEGHFPVPAGWECFAWKTQGGYGSQGEGRGRKNAAREVVYFSPHCLKVDLFSWAEGEAGS